jgi:hypothetical protein
MTATKARPASLASVRTLPRSWHGRERRRRVLSAAGREGWQITAARPRLKASATVYRRRFLEQSRSGGMADATDSKSVARKGVWVQVPPPAVEASDSRFGLTWGSVLFSSEVSIKTSICWPTKSGGRSRGSQV